eukprot:8814079-Ditylum_brightwellii.AAC.1
MGETAPSTFPAIVLCNNKQQKRHLNIINHTFNLGTMTMETRQVEVGKSSMHLPVPNVPMCARPKNPYVTNKKPTNTVFQPYVVTSTPSKSETPIKTSITLPKKPTSKKYLLAEFYPAKKTGIESLGPGTQNIYAPKVHDMPSTQRAVVPYAAARNPYASSC